MSNNLKIEDRNEILMLIDSYQNLLTENQRNIVLSYYQYDLSFSEIAENEHISRAAVSDCINKSIQKMKEFEAALHHIELKKMIEKAKSEISENCTDLQKLATYEKLVEDINNGI